MLFPIIIYFSLYYILPIASEVSLKSKNISVIPSHIPHAFTHLPSKGPHLQFSPFL